MVLPTCGKWDSLLLHKSPVSHSEQNLSDVCAVRNVSHRMQPIPRELLSDSAMEQSLEMFTPVGWGPPTTHMCSFRYFLVLRILHNFNCHKTLLYKSVRKNIQKADISKCKLSFVHFFVRVTSIKTRKKSRSWILSRAILLNSFE